MFRTYRIEHFNDNGEDDSHGGRGVISAYKNENNCEQCSRSHVKCIIDPPYSPQRCKLCTRRREDCRPHVRRKFILAEKARITIEPPTPGVDNTAAESSTDVLEDPSIIATDTNTQAAPATVMTSGAPDESPEAHDDHVYLPADGQIASLPVVDDNFFLGEPDAAISGNSGLTNRDPAFALDLSGANFHSPTGDEGPFTSMFGGALSFESTLVYDCQDNNLE